MIFKGKMQFISVRRTWRMICSLFFIAVFSVTSTIILAQTTTAMSGKLNTVLPSINDKSDPIGTLHTQWKIKVESDRPVVYLDLYWTSTDIVDSKLNFDLVAAVQAPSLFLAFMEIPISQSMDTNHRYKIRTEYTWDRFLKTDSSNGNKNYLSKTDARTAFNSGIIVFQLATTNAKAVQD